MHWFFFCISLKVPYMNIGAEMLWFTFNSFKQNVAKFYVKSLSLLSNVTKTGMCQQILVTLPNIKFHEN
jgi:hypothetical protein